MKSYISRKLPLATRMTEPSRARAPGCTSGAPRDERQHHVRRARAVHMHGVARHAPRESRALRRTGVGIHVEVREVARGNIEADAVSAHEAVRSRERRDGDPTDLARLHERRFLEGVTVT